MHVCMYVEYSPLCIVLRTVTYVLIIKCFVCFCFVCLCMHGYLSRYKNVNKYTVYSYSALLYSTIYRYVHILLGLVAECGVD